MQPRQTSVRKRYLLIGCVEDNENGGVPAVVASIRIQPHHNQSRNLVRAGIQERKTPLNFGEGRHAEESRTVSDLQELAKRIAAVCDVLRLRRVCRVSE